ncbi:MAG: hypothetical protein IPO17_04130 [Flavobacteriales bacterium]|nr:hypothetical protein [Flavobacteriales bacterium]
MKTSNEVARPFLPAKDLGLSKRFYEALGFAKLLDSDEVVIFRIGASSFLLQKHFQKEWAENFMMQPMVDDSDAWWTHISSVISPNIRVPVAESTGTAALGLADRLRC